MVVIHYEQVEESCNELHQLAKNMKELVDKINNTSKKLSSNESWNGMAANYYISKMDRLCKNFDEMFAEIENSILYMAKCSGGYQEIDKVVMNEICINLNIQSPNLSNSKIFF